MKIILSPLKRFPLGVYRIIIILWFPVPFIANAVAIEKSSFSDERLNSILAMIFSIPAYYFFVRLILWVYEGFKEQNRKIK